MSEADLIAYRVFPSGDEGGNVAGVVLAPRWPNDMARRAREAALPTVAFARRGRPGVMETRLFTVDGEIEACGHASVAVAAEAYRRDPASPACLLVRSPGAEIECRADGEPDRPTVTMTVAVSAWSVVTPPPELAALRVTPRREFPAARVETGLRHLIVTVANAASLSAIDTDHERWQALGRKIGVDTIGIVALAGDGVAHLRDICAPIGDTEEAASGTTASAVTWHLGRLGLGDGFEIHQGVDMGNPSLLRTAIADEGVEVSGDAVPVES